MRAFHMAWLWGLSVSILLVALVARGGFAADEKSSPGTLQQAAVFENKIRPLLADHCYSCHGEKEQRGGLRLDSRASILKGNAHGPAIIPGNPEKSLLILAIHCESKIKMPPSGKLKPEE